MKSFSLSQRWYSTSEPELGIGIISQIDGRMVSVFFPARDATRSYEMDDAPLARAILNPGSHARSRDGLTFIVSEIKESEGTVTYLGEGNELHESELADTMDLATPENRLKSKQCDKYPLFDLRYKTLETQHKRLSSNIRGFSGGRIQLFPHQLYIASEVCSRHQVRVLLSDEVGLGKTIEAALIIHRMILTGRIERVLVLVPNALVHQWFAEMYLRFNLTFKIVDKEYLESYNNDTESLYLEDQLLICPIDLACEITIREANWDLVAIDEAHHLEVGSESFKLAEDLSKSCPHLLLLSATPEQYGEEGHFQRLRLLDHARFHSYNDYLKEQESYRSVAQIAQCLYQDDTPKDNDIKVLKQVFNNQEQDKLIEQTKSDSDSRKEILSKLLDQHGIGRLMFRNVRHTIGGFPNRLVYGIPLEGTSKIVKRHKSEFKAEHQIDESFRYSSLEEDPRIQWFKEFLESRPNEKVVVICANRLKSIAIADAIVGNTKMQIARFHEQMSLLERDRQAAWFSDPGGPQCMVSSPIGAEGRNFQCAKYLVLFDLPLEPEQLEQRIGRLDRIGQGEEIYIYVPYIEKTPQARLFRWYDEALSSMEQPWHGSRKINDAYLNQLPKQVLDLNDSDFDNLLQEAKVFNQEIIKELENGRDLLLELNSYDPKEANQLAEQIDETDTASTLEQFMIEALDRSGIDAEEIASRSYALKPNIFYTQPFPGFKEEGMAITFDRAASLKHDEWHFLSWDSPMVRDALDLIISNERGNASVARMNAPKPNMILEAIYVVQSTTALHLQADRFFPPTAIRIACDMNDALLKEGYFEKLPKLENMDGENFLSSPKVISHIDHMLDTLNSQIQEHVPRLVEQALSKMFSELSPAYERLVELGKINPSISEEEINSAHEEMDELEEGLSKTQVRLDALRLIACYPKR